MFFFYFHHNNKKHPHVSSFMHIIAKSQNTQWFSHTGHLNIVMLDKTPLL